jgi:phosphate transport system ATP-binding protein
MNSNIPKIKIKDLSVSFNEQIVLADISLDLFPGQINVAVGPSGSGKTTFLRSFNRLNDFFAGCKTRGKVFIHLDARDIDCYAGDYPLSRLRQKVGMVFQHPNLLPFSVSKNLALPLKLTLGLKKSEIEERIHWSLKEVGLWDEVKDRLDKSALDLSGGQQQRLCLARVIILKPEVILLDEPTASLDFRATSIIEEMIKKLKEKYTIMAVTHSLSQMQRMADRIFVFKQGRVINTIDDYSRDKSEECLNLIQKVF